MWKRRDAIGGSHTPKRWSEPAAWAMCHNETQYVVARGVRHVSVLLLGSMMVICAGCGGRQHAQHRDGQSETPTQTFNMQPVVIRAHPASDGGQSAQINLHDTFEEASAYYKAGDDKNAIRLYAKILDTTDAPIWNRAALYNIGLAQEHQGAWADAAQTFDTIITGYPTSREGRDAYFRLAEALARMGEFQRVPALMDTVMQRPDITEDRRIEALVRKGSAYVELRELTRAQKSLKAAVTFEKTSRENAINAGKPVVRGQVAQNGIAQADYLLGRIYHEIFSEIRMVLPVERYKKDLADKDRLFHQALDWYIKAVKTGNTYWAPQAGYEIGQLYEDYYFDLLASEVPQNFTKKQRKIYFDALRSFLAPGLNTAIDMYERALGMAYRMGSHDAVVNELLDKISTLEKYRKNKREWKAEDEEIFAGEHPHSPNPARNMVFRDEVIPGVSATSKRDSRR